MAGCWRTTAPQLLEEAAALVQSKDWPAAEEVIDRIIKRFPGTPQSVQAAQLGAQVAGVSQARYEKSAFYLRYIVVHSESSKDRNDAQINLAAFYFDKLQNYSKAIEAYSELLAVIEDKPMRHFARMRLARSFYYLEDFFQALVEVEQALKDANSRQQKVEAMLFRGDLFLTAKKMDLAIDLYKTLMAEFSDAIDVGKVGMNLAVAYEESGDFDAAAETLERLKTKQHPSPEFLEFKIKRLKQRKLDQPGAKGLRK